MSAPQSWREVSLGEVCEFKYGKSLPEAARAGGEVPVFGSNGEVGRHDVAITHGPTIVIGRKGSFGEVLYSETACWPIDTTYFVDETATKADLRWLTYRLTDLGLKSLNRAAAIPGLNREDAYRQHLLLPPLAEQRRIAAILDKADVLRTKRRAALGQLEALALSVFLEMFGDPATNPKGWPVFSLGAMLIDVTNGMTRRRPESDAGQSVVLRLRDIREGWIDFSDVNRITLTASEASKYEVNTGDLLFVRVNGNPDYVGRCALFEGFSEKVYFNDHVMRVRVDRSTIRGDFLAFILNGSHGKGEIAKYRKTSAGQHTINQEGLGRIRLPVPPLPLQEAFATRIAAIGQVENGQTASLSALDSLFITLQHRAFRGMV